VNILTGKYSVAAFIGASYIMAPKETKIDIMQHFRFINAVAAIEKRE
jgi:hypothetical protein